MKSLSLNLIFVLLLITNLSCSYFKEKRTDDPTGLLNLDKFDTTKIALFVSDEAGYMIPIEYKKSPLTENDFAVIENILEKAVQDYNMEHSYPISLANHRRQYKYYINEAGEREVWVNCFCGNQSVWREIQVMDFDNFGCNFDTRINLSQEKYEMLFVHGKH